MPDGEELEWLNKDGEPLDGVPLPPELQQDGYWVTTEAGNTAHVLVSPTMSPEGWKILDKLIDAAAKHVEEGGNKTGEE